MAMSLLQDVFSSLQEVSEEKAHSVGTLHEKCTVRMIEERLIASRSSEVWWNSESSQLPRSFAGLIRVYFSNAAKFLKFNADIGYPAHVMRLHFMERMIGYVPSQGYTVLGFLPVDTAERVVEDGDFEIDGRTS